jgi:predicted HicB family RNase H-like nuclease
LGVAVNPSASLCVAASANGAIRVRLPRSVHAALLAEAKAEGGGLNQLCLSELVAQVRAVVQRSRSFCRDS